MSTFKEMTDEELALLYVNGNNKAFDELLLRVQDKIFTYIMYMVKDENLANDLFQETFIKAITKLQNGLYTNSGKFVFWMTRIAHNVIIDHYREIKCERIIEPTKDNDLENLKGASVLDTFRESEMVNEQVRKDVKRLMNALPENQREVVYMRFFQQMSFKEIAEETGVSINTSLGRMRYALINLRKLTRQHRVNLHLECSEVADNLLRILGTKDVTTADEYIDTGCNETWGRLALHTAIHLNQRLTALFRNQPTQVLHLVDSVLNELLSAEPGVDAHQQDHLYIADNILQERHRRRGIQRNTGLHASIVNLLNGAMQMDRRLHVDVHHHGTKFGSLLNVTLGTVDHVVNVEGFGTCFGHRLKYRKAKGNVGNERAVHHVEVKPVGLTVVDHLDVAVEMKEIGSEQ